MARMMYGVAAAVVILWLIGFICGFAGAYIHILLPVALLIALVKLSSDRKHPNPAKKRAGQGRRDIAAPKTWNLK